MPKQKSIPKENEKKLNFHLESTSIHVGPIPYPKTLKEYKDISPDFPERIIKMAENEQEFKINVNKKIVNRGAFGDLLSRIFAFVVVCLFIMISYILIKDGETIAGTIFAGSTLTVIVGTFIYGTNSNRNS